MCPLFDVTTTGLKSKHITHFHPFLSISASAPTASLPVFLILSPTFFSSFREGRKKAHEEAEGAERTEKIVSLLRAAAPAADPGRMVNE